MPPAVPLTTKVAPEAPLSPVMVAPMVAVWMPSPANAIVFELRVTAIGVNGIVTNADFVGSVTLVAVTTALAVLTGLGAVNKP